MKIILLSFVLFIACSCLSSGGGMSIGPNGATAPSKYVADQNMLYADMSTSRTIITAYSDSGYSLNALAGIVSGAIIGYKFGGAPGAAGGAAVGGLAGSLAKAKPTTDTVTTALNAIAKAKAAVPALPPLPVVP